MDNLILRPASQADAADLAILDNIAGHGISQWFWQGAVMMGKASDAYDWGRARMLDAESIFGWKNATVAESAGVVLGAACSYPMPMPDPGDEKQNPEPFKPVFELFCQSTGDWFVDSLAVYQAAKGKRIGARLLDDCFAKGAAAGAARISLVVEDSNEDALGLYGSRGMIERDRRPYIPFNKSSDTKNWLLLSAQLS